jgi:hypothetical protein
MKSRIFFTGLFGVLLFTSCPTKLDENDAKNLKNIVPSMIGGTVDVFGHGGTVDVFNAPNVLANHLQSNPKVVELFGSLAHSNLLTRVSKPRQSVSGCPSWSGDLNANNSPIDADQDYYPKNAIATFVNCPSTDPKTSVTSDVNGTIQVTDQNDSLKTSGFRAIIDLDVVTPATPTEAELVGYVFTDTTTNLSGSTYKATDSQIISATQGSVSVEVRKSSSITYTPQNASDPWGNGTLNFQSQLSNNFTVAGTSGTESYNLVVKNLVIDNSCGTPEKYKSGTVEVSSGSDKLLWNITDCGTGTWSYNGKPI